MEKLYPTTSEPKASKIWERLEDFVREHVQQFIQALLEEEVTELLGRTSPAQADARMERATLPRPCRPLVWI